MTTPRVVGLRPNRARNQAALALLQVNPGETVLVEELENTTYKERQGLSARAAGLKRHADFPIQVWTEFKDGVARSFAKLSPQAAPAPTVLAAATVTVTPTQAQKQPTRASKRRRTDAEILATLQADQRLWYLVTSRKNHAGITKSDRSNPDYMAVERRRNSLLNTARRAGVKIRTRIVATPSAVRLEAAVVRD